MGEPEQKVWPWPSVLLLVLGGSIFLCVTLLNVAVWVISLSRGNPARMDVLKGCLPALLIGASFLFVAKLVRLWAEHRRNRPS